MTEDGCSRSGFGVGQVFVHVVAGVLADYPSGLIIPRVIAATSVGSAHYVPFVKVNLTASI